MLDLFAKYFGDRLFRITSSSFSTIDSYFPIETIIGASNAAMDEEKRLALIKLYVAVHYLRLVGSIVPIVSDTIEID
jgi:hypothetical protein